MNPADFKLFVILKRGPGHIDKSNKEKHRILYISNQRACRGVDWGQRQWPVLDYTGNHTMLVTDLGNVASTAAIFSHTSVPLV